MIILHRLNGEEILLNSDLIEIIEEKPDTVITLSNDRKYIVKEKSREIVDKIIEFKTRFQQEINSRQRT